MWIKFHPFHICVGKILERFFLHALDRYWHNSCLKCSCCGATLGDIGTSCFTRSGMILCKADYSRWVTIYFSTFNHNRNYTCVCVFIVVGKNLCSTSQFCLNTLRHSTEKKVSHFTLKRHCWRSVLRFLLSLPPNCFF